MGGSWDFRNRTTPVMDGQKQIPCILVERQLSILFDKTPEMKPITRRVSFVRSYTGSVFEFGIIIVGKCYGLIVWYNVVFRWVSPTWIRCGRLKQIEPETPDCKVQYQTWNTFGRHHFQTVLLSLCQLVAREHRG